MIPELYEHRMRWMVVAERGSDRIVLRELETRKADNSGQGEGGSLGARELLMVVRPGDPAPLLRWGSIAHTDSAKEYRNLGREGPPRVDPAPQSKNIAFVLYEA